MHSHGFGLLPRCCAAGALLFGSVSAFAAGLTFYSANLSFVGVQPFSVAAADLDADGHIDLVAAGAGAVCVQSPHLAPNSNAIGGQYVPTCYYVGRSSPSAQESFAIADLDDDGKPEIIAANSLDASVTVLHNHSGVDDPVFEPESPLAVGVLPYSVAIADFNGDGKPDVVVSNLNSGTLSVLLNTTAAGTAHISFAPQQTLAAGTHPFAVASADLDGDGRPDLLISGDGAVSALMNRTAAGASTVSFSAPSALGAASSAGLPALAVADFNGDGKIDVAVAGPSHMLTLYLNATPGPGATPAFNSAGVAVDGDVYAVDSDDIDGDGRPDLIVIAYNAHAVTVLRNTTIATSAFVTFSTQTFAAGVNPAAIAFADVDGDGRRDIIVGDVGGAPTYLAGYALLLNTTGVANVNLNQHGLTGSWFNPATGGQGLEIEVYPDSNSAGNGLLFGGWFAYDDSGAAQRWFGLTGNVKSAEPTAFLQLFGVAGGNFVTQSTPGVPYSGQIGEATLELVDCNNALLSYHIVGNGDAESFLIDSRQGVIPLTRLIPNAQCTRDGAAGAPSSPRALLSGNWFDPNTGGQGFIFDFAPDIHTVFAAWYTFAPAGVQASGANAQRWYTLQGTFGTDDTLHDIPIIATSGGKFDSATPTPASIQVGSADLSIESCAAMTLTYRFTSGINQGLTGAIPLRRTGPVPAGCAL